MKDIFVLSHVQAEPLVKAWQERHTFAVTSLDLGLSTLQLDISPTGVSLPNGQQLDWKFIEQIVTSDNKCFVIRDKDISEIKLFSEFTKI